MPIFDYECADCGEIFENIEVWESHRPTACKKCGSSNIKKVIGLPHVQMDADFIKHSYPDPQPPLEELRGKNKYGEGGYSDKPEASTRLRDYDRHKDKDGNWVWTEKRRMYFDQGGKK